MVDTSKESGFSDKLSKLIATTVNPEILEHLKRRQELGVDENNCTHFIRRKQRFCSRRAVAGSINGTCSEHSEEGLAESRKQNDIARARHDQKLKMKAETSGEAADPEEEQAAKRKRVSAPKRMANPFSTDLTPEIDPHFDWTKCYADASLPLHIDIGCAKGRCVERLSQRPERRNWNQLGLEIRDSLVQYSLERMTDADKERKNLHFMTNNFALSADQLLATLPNKCTRLVSFQFPDPWRRAKHEKRLIVQPNIVQILAKHMSEGAAVYLSSDCEQVAERMRLIFSKSEYFRIVTTEDELFTTSSSSGVSANSFFKKISPENQTVIMDENSWIKINPLDEPSERELVCELEWKRVWRCVFVRNNKEYDVNSVIAPLEKDEVISDEENEEDK